MKKERGDLGNKKVASFALPQYTLFYAQAVSSGDCRGDV